MTSLFLVIYFCFGLIVGSFINVVVLRSGARPVSGRSACMSCGAKIPWFDLIPVFSWIWLRGRCRACGSRISMQYPAVEFLTGVIFALVGGASLTLFATALGLLLGAVLIAIAAYDLRHTIIPNAWVWSFNALALLSVFLPTLYPIPYTLWPILAGPAVALPLFALWLVSGGKWIGLGDSKLALGIGWLLGPQGGIKAVLLAFITGAIVGLGLIAFSSVFWKEFVNKFTPTFVSQKFSLGFTMKSEVPFGPFLIAACMFVWMSQMYNIQIPFLWQ